MLKFQEIAKTSDTNMVKATMNLFDCFMGDFLDEKYREQVSDLDIRAQIEGSFFFACIWSMGGTLDANSRPKFNMLFRALLEREFPEKIREQLGIHFEIAKPEKPYIFTIPSGETVFDYRYIKEVRKPSYITQVKFSRLKRAKESGNFGLTIWHQLLQFPETFP